MAEFAHSFAGSTSEDDEEQQDDENGSQQDELDGSTSSAASIPRLRHLSKVDVCVHCLYLIDSERNRSRGSMATRRTIAGKYGTILGTRARTSMVALSDDRRT